MSYLADKHLLDLWGLMKKIFTISFLSLIFLSYQNFTNSDPLNLSSKDVIVNFYSNNSSFGILGSRLKLNNKKIAGNRTIVDQFLGIPYAKKPIGSRRWTDTGVLDPYELQKKSGDRIYNAKEMKPACPQESLLSLSNTESSKDIAANMSEDCLYLNIWRPADVKQKENLPVVFWIHGGGFVRNSIRSSKFQGDVIASHGVVVITVAYRLGVLGFFGFPGLNEEQINRGELTGNYGLIDVINALKWTQNNIKSFGGDPENVTIFGTSAGGATVNTLMASDYIRGLSKPLFHKAISQSGGGVGSKLPLISKNSNYSAQNVGLELWDQLKNDSSVLCKPDKKSPFFNQINKKSISEARMLLDQAFLRSIKDIELFKICIHYSDILRLSGLNGNLVKVKDENGVLKVKKGEFRNYPFVDGQILSTKKIIDSFKTGKVLNIPYINGSAVNEASVVHLQGKSFEDTAKELVLGEKGPKVFKDGRPANGFKNRVLAIAELYGFDLPRNYNEMVNSEDYKILMGRFFSDMYFSLPSQLISFYQSQNLKRVGSVYKSYSYEYGYLTINRRKKIVSQNSNYLDRNDLLKYSLSAAGHSQESFPLFGKFSSLTRSELKVADQDNVFSKGMILRWVSFAYTGDPNESDEVKNYMRQERDQKNWLPNLNSSTVYNLISGYDFRRDEMFFKAETFFDHKNNLLSHFNRVND